MSPLGRVIGAGQLRSAVSGGPGSASPLGTGAREGSSHHGLPSHRQCLGTNERSRRKQPHPLCSGPTGARGQAPLLCPGLGHSRGGAMRSLGSRPGHQGQPGHRPLLPPRHSDPRTRSHHLPPPSPTSRGTGGLPSPPGTQSSGLDRDRQMRVHVGVCATVTAKNNKNELTRHQAVQVTQERGRTGSVATGPPVHSPLQSPPGSCSAPSRGGWGHAQGWGDRSGDHVHVGDGCRGTFFNSWVAGTG